MEDVRTLTSWRRLRAMTLRDLADAAGVTQQTLVNISKGKTTRFATMKKVAAALDVEELQIDEFRRQLDQD